MPQAMTFNSLKDDIRSYLERGASIASDPLVFAQIPKLINFAERRISRDLKIQGFQTVLTTTLQSGLPVYPKPDRWRETISINIGTGVGSNKRKTLFVRSYEYVREYWPDQSEVAEPIFYTDYSYNNWLIAPTPDEDYPLEVLFYELPPLLDDDNQSNWLTAFAPNLLLYASLLEAEPYLKNDERIAVWQNMYAMAAQAINGEDLKKILDRSATRNEA
jgi:hypothetical protein